MTQQIVNYETNYRPGALARLCAMQSTYYAREWAFDHRYEAVVAAGVGEFLSRYDPAQDLIVLAVCDVDVIGGIVIDGGNAGDPFARLRWFIVSDSFRGHGIGRELIARAMDFVERQKFEKVFLTTFDGLDTARTLYENAGFRLADQAEKSTWGKPVIEQRFEFTAAS